MTSSRYIGQVARPPGNQELYKDHTKAGSHLLSGIASGAGDCPRLGSSISSSALNRPVSLSASLKPGNPNKMTYARIYGTLIAGILTIVSIGVSGSISMITSTLQPGILISAGHKDQVE
jgi:hypothetical protein